MTNQIIIYGGHGHEFDRTTYTDKNGITFRGTGKEAKAHFRKLYPANALIFKISKKS